MPLKRQDHPDNSPHGLIPTFFQRPDQLDERLYVVTCVFNATRYRTRWKLYEDFARMVNASSAILYTVEVAFGNRHFSVTDPDNPHHLQLRTTSEMWHKEPALNLLIQRLPLKWKKVAWVDADISFSRHDWTNETLQQLEHFPVVQMWSDAQDLGPNHEPLARHHSFVHSWQTGEPVGTPGGYYQPHPPAKHVYTWHPGLAWAWRREAFDQVGGFIDWAILGAADNHMANALIGRSADTVHPDVQGDYRTGVARWEDRAVRYLKKNIGIVPGLVLHYHHGPKAARRYWDRWKIITNNQFSPSIDLKRDWHGLYQLVTEDERQETLRDQLRAYFSQRNEDSPEV